MQIAEWQVLLKLASTFSCVFVVVACKHWTLFVTHSESFVKLNRYLANVRPQLKWNETNGMYKSKYTNKIYWWQLLFVAYVECQIIGDDCFCVDNTLWHIAHGWCHHDSGNESARHSKWIRKAEIIWFKTCQVIVSVSFIQFQKLYRYFRCFFVKNNTTEAVFDWRQTFNWWYCVVFTLRLS